MTLVPCSECAARVSDRAVVCPGCGNPLRPRDTWRRGFSHAWKAAVGFPLVYGLAMSRELFQSFQGMGTAGSAGIAVLSMPFSTELGLLILPAYGFIAGLAAVAASELVAVLLRAMGRDVARWKLAEPAVYAVIAAFGLFVAVVAYPFETILRVLIGG